MWKKHKNGLVACGIVCISIVLLLLLMVFLFEKIGIHVPGSREMWIGLIGSIIGGAFTLFGVLITIYRQEDSEEEKKRLDYQPIIGFEIIPYKENLEDNVDSIITCFDGAMTTSAFSALESKRFSVVKIFTLTTTVFNFVIEDIMINGKVMPLDDSFAPLRCRIASGETKNMVFDYDECDRNMFWLVRFSYDDIFGNHYLQDLPIIYSETTSYMGDNGEIRQIVEIRDIQAPIYVNRDNCKASGLNECAKKYADYETFVEQH